MNFIAKLIFLPIMIAVMAIMIGNNKKNTQNIDFIGSIQGAVYLNGHSIIKTERSLLKGSYVLEKDMRLENYSMTSIAKSGNKTENKSKLKFYGFMLDNVDKKVSYTFTTDSITPTLINIIPLSDKRSGLIFRDNSSIVHGFENQFRIGTDSVINNNLYTTLICIPKNSGSDPRKIEKIILYLDKKLKNLPIHPISEVLDKKFNGTIVQAIIYADKGQTMSAEFKVERGLSKTDQDKINKFIEVSKNNK